MFLLPDFTLLRVIMMTAEAENTIVVMVCQ